MESSRFLSLFSRQAFMLDSRRGSILPPRLSQELQMLVLPGSSALSDARLELLAAEVSAVNPAYRLREALYAYAVDLEESAELDSDRLAVLLVPALLQR